MQLVKWKFRGLEIAVVRDGDDLFCTSAALCSALGMTQNQLKMVVRNNRDQLAAHVVSNRHHLIEFLKAHSHELPGEKQVQKGTRLWSIDQALKVAYLARTNVSWEFIEASIELVRAEAREGYVSREEWTALENRYAELEKSSSARIERLEQIVLDSKTSLELAATAAGRSLQAQHATKKLRLAN